MNRLKFALEMIRDVVVMIAFFLYLVMAMVWCALCKALHNDDDVDIVETLNKSKK